MNTFGLEIWISFQLWAAAQVFVQRGHMDFIDEIKKIADRVAKYSDSISTEEATKQALVLPFIDLLGFDIYDPHEVCPEYTADVGVKKGEQVDYAILIDN